MRIHEIITETFALKNTMAAVAADIGNNVTNTFDELKKSAGNFYGNRGDLAGWEFIGASIEARTWWDRIWAPRTDPKRMGPRASSGLQGELYDLARQAGRSGKPLQDLLREMIVARGNFTSLAHRLIPILRNIAREHENKTLETRVDRWQAQLEDYEQWIGDLIQREAPRRSKKTVSKDVETPSVRNEPSALPGQNAAAEKIVNNVLQSLPAGIAGDIRTAIARSSNKIQALRAELQKRGISV